MNRYLIALPFFFYGTFSLHAQWEALPAPAIDIYSIQALDPQTLRAGGNSALFLSNDGGDNWDTLHISFLGTDFPGLLYDVFFTSTANGFAVGAFGTEQAVVLHTTDGGVDWSPAYLDEIGTWPLSTEAIAFPTSTVGIVVGSSGKVLRSTDSGASWVLTASGTSARLYDVKFTSATTGCAVGDNVILRTTNGGLNWSAQSVNGALRSISFLDASNGYAIGEASALFRTTNGGASWQPIVPALMSPVDFTAIHVLSPTLLYATGGARIWRSTDQGIHWEWQSTPAPLEDLAFAGGIGFAAGATGTIMRTGDSEGPYAPAPYFTIAPAIACEDSVLICSNGSAAGLTFTWLLNGTPFATAEDATVVLSEPSQFDTIGLVASNGQASDTAYWSVLVASTLQIQINSLVVDDTLCAGASTTVRVQTSQGGTSYRLYRGITPISAAQVGNGGNLNFNTGPISQNDTLTIQAQRTVTGCGSSTASATHVIFMATPPSTTPFTAEEAALCAGDSTNVILSMSELNTSYQLSVDGTPFGAPQNGTGAPLALPTGPLNTTTNFTITASSSGCPAALTSSAMVIVETAQAYFTLTSWNPVAGEFVDALNSTAIPGATYSWDFGSSATPQTSTEEQPLDIVFTAGISDVSLTVTTTTGCQQTRTAQVHVLAPFASGACGAVQGALDAADGQLVALEFDPVTNDCYAFVRADIARNIMFWSGHGDTLRMSMPYIFTGFNNSEYAFSEVLVKFSPQLVPEWGINLHHGSTWSGGGAIAFGQDSSVYLLYHHGDYLDSLRIHSTDGRYIQIDPPHSGSNFSDVVVKYDRHGRYLWHATYLNGYGETRQVMKVLDNGDLIIMTRDRLLRMSSNGTLLWNVNEITEIGDMEIDGDGNIWTATPAGAWSMLHKYSPAGELLISSPPITIIGTGLIRPYDLEITEDDGLLVSGIIDGTVVLGLDTLVNSSFDNADRGFHARFDLTGSPEWSFLLGTGNIYNHKGGDLHDGVYVSSGWSADSAFIEGQPAMDLTQNGLFLCMHGTDGGLPSLQKVHVDSVLSNWGYGFSRQLTRYNPNTGELGLFFAYTDSVLLNGMAIGAGDPYPLSREFVLLKGLPDCLVEQPIMTPLSFFTVPSFVCAGEPFVLVDASANMPTSWLWDMPGAVPSTSTEADPIVTYFGPGTYSVTLVASNTNGTGTSYLGNVVIDVCMGSHDLETSDLRVYPVPADGTLHVDISTSTGSYCVRDITGREVARGRLNGTSTDIPTAQLANGRYELRVWDTERTRLCSFLVGR